MEFKKYQRKGLSEMIEWVNVPKENRALCSISNVDQQLEKDDLQEFEKGFLARNPLNHKDTWYVAKKYFDENLELVTENKEKTLHNSNASGASVNVKDIIFWGNGDTFKLISKASSKNEGWMKSTKAMQIEGIGCVIQVTTQQGNNIAEALTFVPFAKIEEEKEGELVISRKLVHQ